MEEQEELFKILNLNGYFGIRILPGRGVCALNRMMYTVGIVYGLDEYGYKGRYCYENILEAVHAFTEWDGTGDPSGNWIVNKGERGGDRQNPNRIRNESN